MGWKGTLRSVGAAYRAAKRDSQRRQRELERDARRRQRELDIRKRENERMAELSRAAFEVEIYESRVQALLSVHKGGRPQVDWPSMALVEEPTKPARPNTAEEAARKAEAEYHAGILDRLLKKESVKRARLAREVERARQVDDASYRRMLETWRRKHQEWQYNRDLARRVLALESSALVEAIAKIDPFSDIKKLGTDIQFAINATVLEATISVHSESVVPNEMKSLLQSGRLSVKKMPIGKFNEIFQDYVCGCVLRVANELFSVLPIDTVIVTATDMLLNSATGHLDDTPIVSAVIPRRTLSQLDLEHIDPSDSMTNFIHRMEFKKLKGFQGVDRLTPESISTPQS